MEELQGGGDQDQTAGHLEGGHRDPEQMEDLLAEQGEAVDDRGGHGGGLEGGPVLLGRLLVPGERQEHGHRPHRVHDHEDGHEGRGVQHYGAGGAEGKTGGRRWRTASRPSRASGPRKPSISRATDSPKTGRAWRSHWFMTRLVHCTAVALPAARRVAMATASDRTSSSGTQRVTSPMRSASGPSTKSAVRR